ncbi:MAG: ribonuclease P protein component [Acidobacteria bacterium]|nr:ribonuclease P protein component [Acidobacteriota bacterium]MBV9145783.1 ribonuclease P protein component [Acidobacteriota bacterium]MBV9435358.1 ribonuclease P protein component [Acidobacteriota bacterium]
MAIPREHRLRKHAEFEVVYRQGRRHFSPLLTAFYLVRAPAEAAGKTASETEAGSRIGITVGRALGKATARNRIKRRVREAVGHNLGKITRAVDIVINPKKIVLDAEFAQLTSEVARAFEAIEQKAVSAAYQKKDEVEPREPRRQAQKRAARN